MVSLFIVLETLKTVGLV